MPIFIFLYLAIAMGEIIEQFQFIDLPEPLTINDFNRTINDNSEHQNIPFPLQIKPVRVELADC